MLGFNIKLTKGHKDWIIMPKTGKAKDQTSHSSIARPALHQGYSSRLCQLKLFISLFFWRDINEFQHYYANLDIMLASNCIIALSVAKNSLAEKQIKHRTNNFKNE